MPVLQLEISYAKQHETKKRTLKELKMNWKKKETKRNRETTSSFEKKSREELSHKTWST
jgi:hypothetical protein